MSKQDIDGIFERFKELRVLILGDVMIDAYMWGRIDRISPEAPVPVVSISKREQRLGGAANVAKNIQALGAEAIICGVCGNDAKGDDMHQLFSKNNLTTSGLVRSDERKTSVKTRVISEGQHVVRVDDEDQHDLCADEERSYLKRIGSMMEQCDVVIFEDYNKGVLTEKVIKGAISLAAERNIPTCVDPKKKNFFAYEGVALFKPNLKELAEGLKVDLGKKDLKAIEVAIKQLRAQLKADLVLLTLSEEGVMVNDENHHIHLPAHNRKIADVSGAGDTVISVAALALASGLDNRTIAAMSNLAGGLVCESVGVVPIDAERLKTECRAQL